MRWIVIIMVIVSYYFLLSLGINFLLQDEFIISSEVGGNKTFTLIDTTDVNMSIQDNPTSTTLKSFPETIKIMFGFRTPVPTAIPPTLTVILSFLNWFLLLILGTAVYRIINPLAAA